MQIRAAIHAEGVRGRRLRVLDAQGGARGAPQVRCVGGSVCVRRGWWAWRVGLGLRVWALWAVPLSRGRRHVVGAAALGNYVFRAIV